MNRLVLTCGLALMDTCWLYPWSVLVGVWADPNRQNGVLSAPVILALLLLSAAATHLLGRRVKTSPRGARVALAITAFVAAIVAVRVEHYPQAGALDWIAPLVGALVATLGQVSLPVLGFALALYLWWRGVRLGSQTPGFDEVQGAFRWGIGRLAVFALLIGLTSRAGVLQVLEQASTPYLVGFFFISLLTLGLARLESLRTRTRRPSLNTQWLGVLVAVAAGVVLLALLLAQVVSFDILLVATRPLFDLLGDVVLLLLYVIFIPLAYVMEWIIYLILNALQANGNRPPPQQIQPADVQDALQRFLSQQMSPELLMALKAIGAAVLVGGALLVVVRGLTRWRPTGADADGTNEERDSLWRADEAWARLLAWLRRLLGRERAVSASTPVDAMPGSAEGSEAVAGSVRKLYARLLRTGELAGARRARATTPLEHESALEDVLAPEDVVAELTAAYVRVRYADEGLAEDEEAALAERLAHVQAKNAVE